MKKILEIAGAIALIVAVGASCSSGASSDCDGEADLVDGARFCTYTGPIIETRFNCPPEMPHRHEFADRIVCAEVPDLPEGLAGIPQWEVGEQTDPDTTMPGPATCVDGIGNGCPDTVSNPRASLDVANDLADILWNDVPDSELLRAANAGELATRSGTRAQVERMLADPRAASGTADFWSRYLGIDRLDEVLLDTNQFPSFGAALTDEARRSTLDTIHQHTLIDGDDTREIFTTRDVVVGPETGPIVGFPQVSAYPEGRTWGVNDGRAGVLTHPSFMLAFADDAAPRISARGTQIRRMMCESVPAPPDEVSPEPGNTVIGSARDKLVAATSPAECAACHAIIDQPSFPLEAFDQVGRSRTMDNGFPVDPSGELDQVGLAGPVELGQAMRDDPRTSDCLTRKWMRFLESGDLRQPVSNEDTLAPVLHGIWESGGYRLGDLIIAILLSDAFLQ